MKFLFSKQNNSYGFWPLEMKQDYVDAETWPDKGIEVDVETRDKFIEIAPEGKKLGADNKGLPCWVDIVITKAEQARINSSKKQNLMNNADKQIALLQDTIDLDMAEDGDEEKLKAWKKYRILLSRVDINADTIDWPQMPDK